MEIFILQADRMSDQDLKSELERLRAENEQLKQQQQTPVAWDDWSDSFLHQGEWKNTEGQVVVVCTSRPMRKLSRKIHEDL